MFGQGLALRGPSGSMIKAVDGMCQEQKQVLTAFTATIFFLGVSTIATYYVVMTLLGAHICSAVTVLAMMLWHRYCLRIYNRFKYARPPAEWEERMTEDELDIEKYASGKIGGTRMVNGRPSSIRSAMAPRKKSKGGGGRFFKFFRRTKSHSSADSVDVTESVKNSEAGGAPSMLSRSNHSIGPTVMVPDEDTSRSGAGYGIANITHKGYITVAEEGIFSPKLTRRFMLLLGNKLLWFKDKREYERSPESPLNTRPLVLEDYTVSTQKIETGVFCIDLVPESFADTKKIFHFRCDTLEELNGWVGAFKTVMRSKSVCSTARTPLVFSGSNVNPSTGGGASQSSRAVQSQLEDDSATEGGTESDGLLRRVPSTTSFVSAKTAKTTNTKR